MVFGTSGVLVGMIPPFSSVHHIESSALQRDLTIRVNTSIACSVACFKEIGHSNHQQLGAFSTPLTAPLRTVKA